MTSLDRPNDVGDYDLADSKRASGDPADPKVVLFPATERSDPVPAVPVHLCPKCDYNLTGLRELRCPECGRPFTLRDARRRGTELSEESQQDYQVIRTERGKRLGGLAMIALGLILPVLAGQAGGLVLVNFALIGFAALIVAFFTHATFKRWTHAALVIGGIALLIGGVMAIV